MYIIIYIYILYTNICRSFDPLLTQVSGLSGAGPMEHGPMVWEVPRGNGAARGNLENNLHRHRCIYDRIACIYIRVYTYIHIHTYIT